MTYKSKTIIELKENSKIYMIYEENGELFLEISDAIENSLRKKEIYKLVKIGEK
jgi:hypothetical protein